MSTVHGDWDLWEREVPRLRARLPRSVKVAIGFAAVFISVAVVAPVVLVARAGDGLFGAAPSPTSAPSAGPPSTAARAAAPSTSTPTTVPPLPSRYVATTTDGRLVVTTAGERVSATIGTFAPRVALMPGGQAAVVQLTDSRGHGELQWWDVSGQPTASGAPFATDARDPGFSSDGAFLAYTQGSSTLVVLDVGAGTERRWDFPAGHGLQRPSWAPDGRSVVLTDVVGADRRTVIFDTARADGQVADLPSIGGPYRLAAFRGSRPTLVAAGGAVASGYNLLEVDPSTGTARAVYTTPFVVDAIHPDPSGAHALLVTERSALYVWANGSVYQVLDGVLDADW